MTMLLLDELKRRQKESAKTGCLSNPIAKLLGVTEGGNEEGHLITINGYQPDSEGVTFTDISYGSVSRGLGISKDNIWCAFLHKGELYMTTKEVTNNYMTLYIGDPWCTAENGIECLKKAASAYDNKVLGSKGIPMTYEIFTALPNIIKYPNEYGKEYWLASTQGIGNPSCELEKYFQLQCVGKEGVYLESRYYPSGIKVLQGKYHEKGPIRHSISHIVRPVVWLPSDTIVEKVEGDIKGQNAFRLI